MPSPNVRTWTKGNLEAVGAIASSGTAFYHHVRIGTPDDPYDGRFAFSIKAENVSQLASDEFSEDTIAQMAAVAGGITSKVSSSAWPSNSTSYAFSGFLFLFHEHRLVLFDASYVRLSGKTLAPEIGDKTMGEFFPLPLAEERLLRIFGEPDRVDNSFSW